MERSRTNPSWFTIAVLAAAVGGTTALAEQALQPAPQAAPAAAQPAPRAVQPPQKTVPRADLPPATDGEPQMVFDDLSHDFGRLPDTQHVKHKFRFTNTGTGTLVIQQPTSSCGCSVPFLTKREYAPGESGEIEVTYNPHGRRGAQTQRITINTNSPSTPQIVLEIHAFVRTNIAFEPQSVNFGDVMAGQVARQIVRVQGPAPDFGVTYASTNKGRFVTARVLETRKTIINGEEINETLVEYTFNGKGPRGHFAAMSTVRTTNEVNPLADIYITAEIVGDLQVLPPRVNVGIINGGDAFHRMFRVNSRMGKPFKIINVDHQSTLPEGLDVQWRPVQTGNETSWQIDIRGKAPETMAPINATLTIMTDQDDDNMLSVQVSGAVRPQTPAVPGIDPTMIDAEDR